MDIEADISAGLPYFNMVGLLASEVREARERVRSALKNINEPIPLGRVVISLSPADLRKEGTGFDLPIAVALLCSMNRLRNDIFDDTLMIGELGLDGEIKPVKGILPIVNMAKKYGIWKFVIPYDNQKEGKLVEGVKIISFRHLKDMVAFYSRKESLTCDVNEFIGKDHSQNDKKQNSEYLTKIESEDLKIVNTEQKMDCDINERLNLNNGEDDYSQVYGQETVKRAIVIAVSGFHNLLMVGPPGVGKSILASRIPTVMPSMTMEERIEVSGIQSICGLLEGGHLIEKRPFSSPHHTITCAGLIGGGRIPRPGEITIAHKGVLFLDELPEFHPYVIDALRQPLEEGVVKIYRTGGSYIFPADCLLVAAMNPCRCGYYPDRNRCNCSEMEVKKYLARISGPILDRIDLSVQVPRVSIDSINGEGNTNYHNNHMTSKVMKKMIDRAIDNQMERQGNKRNGRLSIEEIRKYCILDDECKEFMKEAYERFDMSMRGYNKVLKISRTIADIEGKENIGIEHLSEALAYRIR